MSQSDSKSSSDSAGGKSAGITRLVRCPACGKSTEFSPRNSARPFCSQRCRDFDLGNWATERYNLSTPVNEALVEALRDLGGNVDSELDAHLDANLDAILDANLDAILDANLDSGELQTLIESADSEFPSGDRGKRGNSDD